jgi:hypothetical protein
MKTQNISLWLGLLLFVMMTAGCVAANQRTETPVYPVTPSMSSTSASNLEILTPTLTPITTKTPTLTPPPPLESERVKETIGQLLRTTEDCEAPCFWGIVPGQTTLGEAKNIFARLRLLLEYTNALNGADFYESTYGFESGLSVSALLGVQNDVVNNLTIYLDPEKEHTGVLREWLAYSPETLIKEYGLPSRANFFVGRGPKPSYFIDMYFDTADLIIRYHSYDVNSKLRLCPLMDQFDSVRIWLGKDPLYPPIIDPTIIPLEEVTSLTMEEFSKLMTGDPSEACFNLKEEMFP